MARRHIIGEEEIKKMPVSMLVDTGSVYMAINETIQEQLQLPVVEKRKARLANGSIIECDVVAPVEVRFKNRRCTLEDMDVLFHPQRQELIVNPEHPYFAQMKMK